MINQYFSFGEVMVTRSVSQELEFEDIMQLLSWHGSLKQGLLCDEDYRANQYALDNRQRIFSSYEYKGKKYYIITEWDRLLTTILKPSEY